MDWQNSYLRLHPKAALKNLETPYIYHIARDELYEIDEKAVEFLRSCDGTATGGMLGADAEAVEYCMEEGIIEGLASPEPEPLFIDFNAPVSPSLRYLELHLTHRCNLRCAHCYLEPAASGNMAVDDAVAITREFSQTGGLRLLISGGEPMVHNDLDEYIGRTADCKVRRILFTNGTLVTSDNITGLSGLDEIQFSLDGLEKGHDMLRGKGSFAKLMKGVEAAVTQGIAISFSTMIHRDNLDEFPEMARLVEDSGAVEWGIDILSVAGSLVEHRDRIVSYETAAPFMEYGFGGGYHGSSEGYACGRHLMAVMPDSRAVKCGFYMDRPLGDAREGLIDCWSRMTHIPLSELECRDCEALDECRGGCRFRADHPLAPDPAMCCLYGVSR